MSREYETLEVGQSTPKPRARFGESVWLVVVTGDAQERWYVRAPWDVRDRDAVDAVATHYAGDWTFAAVLLEKVRPSFVGEGTR